MGSQNLVDNYKKHAMLKLSSKSLLLNHRLLASSFRSVLGSNLYVRFWSHSTKFYAFSFKLPVGTEFTPAGVNSPIKLENGCISLKQSKKWNLLATMSHPDTYHFVYLMIKARNPAFIAEFERRVPTTWLEDLTSSVGKGQYVFGLNPYTDALVIRALVHTLHRYSLSVAENWSLLFKHNNKNRGYSVLGAWTLETEIEVGSAPFILNPFLTASLTKIGFNLSMIQALEKIPADIAGTPEVVAQALFYVVYALNFSEFVKVLQKKYTFGHGRRQSTEFVRLSALKNIAFKNKDKALYTRLCQQIIQLGSSVDLEDPNYSRIDFFGKPKSFTIQLFCSKATALEVQQRIVTFVRVNLGSDKFIKRSSLVQGLQKPTD